MSLHEWSRPAPLLPSWGGSQAEVSPRRSSRSQSGDKWTRKQQPVSFRRSTAKVERAEVFRKEICQLCCSVRDQESTPPLSKMSRPLLAQPRSKFLRLTCKLKGMCIAREMILWVLSGLGALQKMLFSWSSWFWFSEEFCERSIFLCLSHTTTANTKWVKHVNSSLIR